MWLLNTSTYKLELFEDDRDAKYAILSHRWQEDEVRFQDFEGTGDPLTRKAWPKILAACTRARKDGHTFIWIDTCCIDKKSSAELSEAINSMYRWYKNSKVCYVYLHDAKKVAQPADSRLPAPPIIDNDSGTSEWFTRGWTLQELIAPKFLLFIDQAWRTLGTRGDLAKWASHHSRVPEPILSAHVPRHRYSIAQRMSWAAHRRTTRAEDMAYSLMGLFEINMPMLYGEGEERAFLRLQEEIMKLSDDQSIFAWTMTDTTAYRGLLAKSPSEFADCGQIIPITGYERTGVAYQPTNRGLQISLDAQQYGLDLYLVTLACATSTWHAQPIGIFISRNFGVYARQMCNWIDRVDVRRGGFRAGGVGFKKTFEVRNYPNISTPDATHHSEKLFGFLLEPCEIIWPDGGHGLTLDNGGIRVVARPSTWNETSRILTLKPRTMGTAFGLAVEDERRELYLIAKVGFDMEFNIWVCIPDIKRIPRPQIPKHGCLSPITDETFYDTMSMSSSKTSTVSSFNLTGLDRELSRPENTNGSVFVSGANSSEGINVDTREIMVRVHYGLDRWLVRIVFKDGEIFGRNHIE